MKKTKSAYSRRTKKWFRTLFNLQRIHLTEEDYVRLDTEQFSSAQAAFFGIARKCKVCKAITEFDYKKGRYCPKGCF